MIEGCAGHSARCGPFQRLNRGGIACQRLPDLANQLKSLLHRGEQRIRTIAQHVPAIGNLPSQRSAFARTLGVAAGPIPRDDFRAGVGLQPGSKGRALPIRQQINNLICLKVDQYGAVPLPLAPCPIVNAEDTRCTLAYLLTGPDNPEHRVGADAHAQPLDEARTRFAAKCKTDRTLDITQAQRAASVTAEEILGALCKDALLTPGVETS